MINNAILHAYLVAQCWDTARRTVAQGRVRVEANLKVPVDHTRSCGQTSIQQQYPNKTDIGRSVFTPNFIEDLQRNICALVSNSINVAGCDSYTVMGYT